MNSKKICDMLCGVSDNPKHMDWALLLIRLSVAATFIYHGWAKVSGIDSYITMFGSMGISAFFTYIAAYTEFLGGIALALGIMTRLVGGLFAVIMIVAISLVHFKNGFNSMSSGYEFQLLLLCCSVGLALVGPGSISLHRKWCARH